ncbi:MAG: peroxiredoxin [Pelagibacteraceae bacterium TMED201]|nr:MAG: peroxiredoxin [Pelagibacteraceae bacterium TMED201]
MIKNKLKAPNFKLLSTGNKEIELIKLKSKYIVLYFYPKDDTPGCTLETKDFNKFLNKFKKEDCLIFGISKDDIKSHEKFKKKYSVKFDLLADEDKKVMKSYKVWAKKKFMGREFMGTVRSTYIIDKNKKILNSWNNVKALGHANEVYDFLKNQ